MSPISARSGRGHSIAAAVVESSGGRSPEADSTMIACARSRGAAGRVRARLRSARSGTAPGRSRSHGARSRMIHTARSAPLIARPPMAASISLESGPPTRISLPARSRAPWATSQV